MNLVCKSSIDKEKKEGRVKTFSNKIPSDVAEWGESPFRYISPKERSGDAAASPPPFTTKRNFFHRNFDCETGKREQRSVVRLKTKFAEKGFQVDLVDQASGSDRREVRVMIPAEASTAISLLEKPLSELTEDDIGQITREECRRFLKDRGMRRPSWNKSQAIQQVISLKALLEDNTDSDNLTAGIRIRQKPRNPSSPPLLTSPHSSLPSPTEASGSGDSRCARTPAKDPSPYRRKYPISPGFTVCDSPRVLTAGVRPQLPTESLRPPPRTVADDTTEQLTIFYGGKVNVYEGVPFDKAREIFHLAATQDPIDSSSLTPVPSSLSFLHRFPPYFAGPLDRRPVGDLGYHLNLPAGKLQRRFKDNLAEGKALREPLPGKRAEIGNGGSGRVQQVEKHH